MSMSMSVASIHRVLRICERSKIALWTAVRTSATSEGDPPAPPVMPLSTYFRFMLTKIKDVKKSNPDMSTVDISYTVAAIWEALPKGEKKKYRDETVTAKRAFIKETEMWWSNLQESQKRDYLRSVEENQKEKLNRILARKLRRLGKPRQPNSAFHYFVADRTNKMDAANTKERGYRYVWKSMSDLEKEPYNVMAQEDLQRFNKERLIWELKIIREGLGHHLK